MARTRPNDRMTRIESPLFAHSRCRALLLDFDGVILQSAALKTRAFAAIYQGADPRLLAEVLEYVERNGGVTRADKFAHIERTFFGREGGATDVARLAGMFRARVFDAVIASPFVPGAQRLLELAFPVIDLHVVSGTPHDELVEIVTRRGLARWFASVHGAPPAKRTAFEAILRERSYASGEVLAIGDAPTEYEAARELGIAFLAVVPEGAPNRFPPGVPAVTSLEPVPDLLELR